MMIRTQISLSPEQHAGLTQLAEDRGASMSALIRDAVDQLLALSEKSATSLLLDIAGKYSDAGGVQDVARQHDDLLAEEIMERLEARRVHRDTDIA